MKFCFLVILALTTYHLSYAERKKKILILGGNGFIGSHVLHALSEENYEITLVNRGNVYFNSDKEVLPFADKLLTCDRNTLLRSTCPGLLGKTFYEAVVDFSSYNDKQIEQVIDILKNRVGLYVLISTDAVYEVSEKYHGEKTREEDSRNEPKDQKKKDELEKNNKYGAAKKGCEERLQVQREHFGFPYVILRLADAIGERDTSYRWWNYQLWMRLHKAFNTTISLPNSVKDHKFSMVHAKDVATYLSKILKEPFLHHDQVINLAFKEELTLTKVLQAIQSHYALPDTSYDHDDEKGFFRYPTAERGSIDITNAEILLDWTPTSFDDAASATCEFFDEAMMNPLYAKEREIALADFIEETLPETFEDENLFVKMLTNIYGPAVFKGIDIGLGISDSADYLIEAKEEL